MYQTSTSSIYLRFLVLLLGLALALSACSTPTAAPTPTAMATVAAPVITTIPTATTVATVDVTTIPVSTEPDPTQTATSSVGQNMGPITVDFSGIAKEATAETVPAVDKSQNPPWWEVMPQYDALTLQGYPVVQHEIRPQLFVFPIKELGVNESAGKMVEDLKALLQTSSEGKNLPFLPLYQNAQVLHAQVKYLDFKNGQGVRFLTQYNSGMAPINNSQLFYTFQGLTSDGNYYVSAVLPVTLAGLPETAFTATDFLGYLSDYTKHVINMADLLNEQSASAFTPDLSKLDAMVQSIEVK